MRHVNLVAMLAAFAAGCGQPAANTAASKASTTAPEAPAADAKGHAGAGWWCNEHGVPEHDCALCDDKVAAAYKAKGDWCKEHERPESQCFLCDPKRAERFAGQYRAKFGKEPPAIADENVKGTAKPGEKKS